MKDDKPRLLKRLDAKRISLTTLVWDDPAHGIRVEVSYDHGEDSIDLYSLREVDQLINRLKQTRRYFR